MLRRFPRLIVMAALGGVVLGLLAMGQQKTDDPKAPGAAAKGEPQAQGTDASKKDAGKTQDAPKKQDEPPQFISTTLEVILPVTVRDEKGRFISNLVKEDFRVLDEGRPQRIEFFSHSEKQPVVVGFLVDQGSNVRIHWDKFKEAIKQLIWSLLPGDPHYTGYLIAYNLKASLLVNTTQDSDKLAEMVDKMKPSAGSALYDAIYRACTDRSLVPGEPYEPRRVIIIVGDGRDNASEKTLGEVLELAQRNMVTIYAVSTESFGFENPDADTLQKLADETGGHVEFPLSNLYKDVSGYLSQPSDDGNYAITVGTGGYAAEISSHIVKAVAGLTGEITAQYVLRYKPDIDPGLKPKDFRRIKVDIPSLPGIRPITRIGYYPAAAHGPTTVK